VQRLTIVSSTNGTLVCVKKEEEEEGLVPLSSCHTFSYYITLFCLSLRYGSRINAKGNLVFFSKALENGIAFKVLFLNSEGH
jgi:hypothetical protein